MAYRGGFPVVKIGPRTASLFAALLGWLLLSALAVFIFWGLRDRARLIRDNENERLFNMLFTGLRSHDDFGSAIEANPVLRERISGFAVYGRDLGILYSWGKAPPRFDEGLLRGRPLQNRFGRITIPDMRGGDSVKFILQTEPSPEAPVPPEAPGEAPGGRVLPGLSALRDLRGPEALRQRGRPRAPEAPGGLSLGPAPPDPAELKTGGAEPSNSPALQGMRGPSAPALQDMRGPPALAPFFNTLARGLYYYVDISHPDYRRMMILSTALFPLSAAALLGAALYIRRLYLRNREYRERIEAQKNLVVLGTAAGTLAHEIKNPLSSIRLQTGILRKTLPGGGEELGIIEEEVDRLSELCFRVNDYLREGAGTPGPLKAGELLDETGRRLLGRELLGPSPLREALVHMDGERLRSVFENLIGNALEAGGPPEEISASLGRSGGFLLICLDDRGRGIDPADRERAFDPFFTRKSRGTGIGLSISRRFVEAAGGRIALDNREGGGVRVRISLPAPGAL
jgi:signal transduction histidine kinase